MESATYNSVDKMLELVSCRVASSVNQPQIARLRVSFELVRNESRLRPRGACARTVPHRACASGAAAASAAAAAAAAQLCGGEYDVLQYTSHNDSSDHAPAARTCL